MPLNHIFKMYGYNSTLIASMVEAASSYNSKSSKIVTSQWRQFSAETMQQGRRLYRDWERQSSHRNGVCSKCKNIC